MRHGVHSARNFKLSNGSTLAEANAAYLTMGELNAGGTNAVMVMHGYTSSHTFIEPHSTAAEGSWSGLIGPGKVIDTDRYFVIASNALGSCYGSTGPASMNPATGMPYGPDFPAITFADIAALQRSLLESLGIQRLHAVIGVSMGGFQTLQWGLQYPDSTDRLAVVLSAFDGQRVAAGAAGLRAKLEGHRNWNAGRYAPGAMNDLLALLRIDTLRNYGMDTWLADQGSAPAERQQIIAGMGEDWAKSFDPGSLLTLMGAMQQFDVRPSLARLKAQLLLVLCPSDALFPASLQQDNKPLLRESRVNYVFHELQSPYGHLASGLDWQKWADALRKFMDS